MKTLKTQRKFFESKQDEVFDYIELILSNDIDDKFISSFERDEDGILLFYRVNYDDYRNYNNTYQDFEKLISSIENIKDVKVSIDRILYEYGDYINFKFWMTEFGSLALSFKYKNTHIKEYSKWNPKVNREVKEFVEDHKYNLPQLWDDNLSEDENVNKMIKYFTNYPDEMKSIINGDKLTLPMNKSTNIKNGAPILQNIGGVHDFKSTIS